MTIGVVQLGDIFAAVCTYDCLALIFPGLGFLSFLALSAVLTTLGKSRNIFVAMLTNDCFLRLLCSRSSLPSLERFLASLTVPVSVLSVHMQEASVTVGTIFSQIWGRGWPVRIVLFVQTEEFVHIEVFTVGKVLV
jgi:hypothetical protein